jgi:hypothetical protein
MLNLTIHNLFLPIMTIAMTALQIKDFDVFLNFTIEIYNRWGALIWQGDNNTIWDGQTKECCFI